MAMSKTSVRHETDVWQRKAEGCMRMAIQLRLKGNVGKAKKVMKSFLVNKITRKEGNDVMGVRLYRLYAQTLIQLEEWDQAIDVLLYWRDVTDQWERHMAYLLVKAYRGAGLLEEALNLAQNLLTKRVSRAIGRQLLQEEVASLTAALLPSDSVPTAKQADDSLETENEVEWQSLSTSTQVIGVGLLATIVGVGVAYDVTAAATKWIAKWF